MVCHLLESISDSCSLSCIWRIAIEVLVSPYLGICSILIVILKAMYNPIVLDRKLCFQEDSIFARLQIKRRHIAVVSHFCYEIGLGCAFSLHDFGCAPSEQGDSFVRLYFFRFVCAPVISILVHFNSYVRL